MQVFERSFKELVEPTRGELVASVLAVAPGSVVTSPARGWDPPRAAGAGLGGQAVLARGGNALRPCWGPSCPSLGAGGDVQPEPAFPAAGEGRGRSLGSCCPVEH